MSKKNKDTKKKSAKKERYAKFRKEKSTKSNFTMPEFTPEAHKMQQENDAKISSFLRYSKNPPTLSLREKKDKSK
ncbi:MAG: hypothetical protein HGA85_08215 [Nanoarchaeota archaeon]|nr:hypothetical protein [Nanoarchaeota archaeon]